jgi:hypothetical protein
VDDLFVVDLFALLFPAFICVVSGAQLEQFLVVFEVLVFFVPLLFVFAITISPYIVL